MEVRRRLDLDSVEAVGHVLGVIAVFVGITGLMLSIGLAEGFSVREDALSELGEPGYEFAWLFNVPITIAGVLAAVFFATLIDRVEARLQRAGMAVMSVAGLALGAVGLFPLGHPLHGPVAIGFFIGLTLGMMLTGLGDRQVGRSRRAKVAFNLVGLHLLAWAFGLTMLEGIALPELVGALAYAIWTLLLVVQRGRDLPT